MREEFQCGKRCKVCQKCKRRYSKEEYDIWNCPDCGHSRKCTQAKMIGKDCCRKHGGKTPTGKASPHYKTGQWSKYDHLPLDIQKRIERLCADKDLYSLEREILTMMARYVELEERLNSGENVGLWGALEKHAAQLRSVLGALESTNCPDTLGALANERDAQLVALLDVIAQGAQRDKTWDDLRENAKLTASLKESHSRMMKDAQALVSVAEVGRLITAIVDMLQSRIDKGLMIEIGRELHKLSNIRTIEALPNKQ
jgi:hypothetical protein